MEITQHRQFVKCHIIAKLSIILQLTSTEHFRSTGDEQSTASLLNLFSALLACRPKLQPRPKARFNTSVVQTGWQNWPLTVTESRSIRFPVAALFNR